MRLYIWADKEMRQKTREFRGRRGLVDGREEERLWKRREGTKRERREKKRENNEGAEKRKKREGGREGRREEER